MRTKSLFNILGVVLLGCVLQSCGGDSGGGSGELKTSYATANVSTAVLDADVIGWGGTVCVEGNVSTPEADSVDVTVTSVPYPDNINGTKNLPIRIDSVTISYAPANSATPAMPSEYQVIGTTIENGSSATIPVRVATLEQKIRLQPKLACSNIIYNYYTTLTFHLIEIGTDETSDVSTAMQLRYADFVDK